MTQLEEALELALKLAPKERLQLIEQLAVSLEQNVEVQEDSEQHWGQNLQRVIDEIGIVELDYPEIEDSVEWVKHLRNMQDKKRLSDWGEDE
jgi:uncharacterized protein YhaN